jgi:hypothetical protein
MSGCDLFGCFYFGVTRPLDEVSRNPAKLTRGRSDFAPGRLALGPGLGRFKDFHVLATFQADLSHGSVVT